MRVLPDSHSARIVRLILLIPTVDGARLAKHTQNRDIEPIHDVCDVKGYAQRLN
jgi:hypothetical protein